ncbi:MAG: GNAT family N-acetyltransferase [Proteobacteria bacterium]|nr:GNAT family N-acetyltransferase [Pseudomonadota bacterium]MBI3498646.1 GNAT family N-acetyltransferase [Pseudomonadota bacterium]
MVMQTDEPARFDDIRTTRLILRRMLPELMTAGLAGDLQRAEQLLGAAIPPDLVERPAVLRFALEQLAADPGYEPWSARALVLAGVGRMVGHVRFHSRPDPPYLHPYVRDAVELGYTIFGADRRRGYASEAVETMMSWAGATHGVRRFVASVSPENAPSLALIARFGFRRIGEHVDEVDGLEHIFLRETADA